MLGECSPLLLMHESGPHRQDELFARMHATAHPIPLGVIDARVPIGIVGIRATPLRNQIVLAHKERTSSIRKTNRPSQPAQHLFGHVVITLSSHRSVDGKWFGHQLFADSFESTTEVAPRCQFHAFIRCHVVVPLRIRADGDLPHGYCCAHRYR